MHDPVIAAWHWSICDEVPPPGFGSFCVEFLRSPEPLEPENDLTASEALEGTVDFGERVPLPSSPILGLAWPKKLRTIWDRLMVFECRYDVWNQIRLQEIYFSDLEHGARVIFNRQIYLLAHSQSQDASLYVCGTWVARWEWQDDSGTHWTLASEIMRIYCVGLWLFCPSCLDVHRRCCQAHEWVENHSLELFSVSSLLDFSAFSAHLVFRFLLEVYFSGPCFYPHHHRPCQVSVIID